MRTTVGLRFLYGYMDYDKQPINVDEQVALLQNRGLVIEDIATAKLQLRNISYFRIASYLRYMEEDRQFLNPKVHIKSVWEKNEESLLVISYFPHFG